MNMYPTECLVTTKTGTSIGVVLNLTREEYDLLVEKCKPARFDDDFYEFYSKLTTLHELPPEFKQ